MKRKANSSSGRATLAVAAILSLFLAANGAMFSVSRASEASVAGVFQALQVSTQVVIDSSARFANDMLALYQLTHLDELTPKTEPAPAPAAWPEIEERERLFLCSESRPMKAPAKATI